MWCPLWVEYSRKFVKYSLEAAYTVLFGSVLGQISHWPAYKFEIYLKPDKTYWYRENFRSKWFQLGTE